MRPTLRSPKFVNVRVLVIEDEAEAREGVAEILKREGHEVFAADEGRKALELMETWRPAVVLLDLHMAGMDGKAFRKEQARDPRLARIPVIVMTGHPDMSVAGDLLLRKPFTPADLVASVARFLPALRRERARPLA